MISYIESMNKGSSQIDLKDKNWFVLEKLYNDNFLNYIGERNQKIPKIIHQVWLGSEYPEKYKILNEQWIKIHPDWELKIWTDKDVEVFNMFNIDIFNQVKNFGTKSDIFRYEILYRYGGIYVDTDFYSVKSFNDLIYLDFFSGNGHVDKVEIFNGLIGCTKENIIIKKIIDELSKKKINESNYSKIMEFTGSYFFTKIFLDMCKNEKCVIFPTTFFYPLPAVKSYKMDFNKNLEKYIKGFQREESYCIHLWYQSWQK